MSSLNIADAKARLSELVGRAEAGEPVEIMRRGKPVVRLVAIDPPKTLFDLDEWRAHMASFRPEAYEEESSVVRMRREARY